MKLAYRAAPCLAYRAALCLVFGTVVPAHAAGTDVVISMSSTGSDVDGGPAARIDSLTVHFTAGDAWQIWADVPALAVSGDARAIGAGAGTFIIQRRNGKGQDGAVRSRAQSTPGGDAVFGLGDVRVGVARRIAGGGVSLFRLDALLESKAPTADESRGLGTGTWDVRGALGFEYRTWPGTIFGNVGWTRYGTAPDVALEDGPAGRLGFEFEPGPSGRTWWVWGEAAREVVPDSGSRASAGVGVRSATGRWGLSGSVGFGGSASAWMVTLSHRFGTARTAHRIGDVVR